PYAGTMAETILITGANRGIGREVCRQLVDRGYAVVLTARRAEAAERAAKTLETGRSPSVVPAALDVADEPSVAALAERMRAEGIRLAALVNNAGASFDGFNAEVAQRTLDTNTFGPMRVSDALLGALDDGARVVNVSSGMGSLSSMGAELRGRSARLETRAQLIELLEEFVEDVRAGRHAERGWPSNAYSVSKAGLNAFTRLFAREQPRLLVNSVCPGWVRTDMGGRSASRSVDKGAAGVVWAATLPANGPTGGFFRDGAPIDW